MRPTAAKRGERLLQRCTVMIRPNGKSDRGTGFFVSQNLVLTCWHVVEGAADDRIEVWRGQRQLSGHVLTRPDLASLDLALVAIESATTSLHPVVRLDAGAAPTDDCYVFGYSDSRPLGDPVLLRLEGHIGYRLKLSGGQVRPGHSGSPILNLRTGCVCAVVQLTRGRESDLGGLGLLVSPKLLQLPAGKDDTARRLWDRVFFGPKRPAWLIERKASPDRPEPFTPAWFLFSESSIRLLGREREQTELEAFLRSSNRFSWWILLGPAGVGKSRLAHAVMQQQGGDWSCGFVDVDDIPKACSDLGQCELPMLLVVDYASRGTERVRQLLRTCAGLSMRPGPPIRVLLIERNISPESLWWQALMPAYAADTTLLLQYQHSEPLTLAGVKDQIRELTSAWLEAGAPDRLGCVPSADAPFWDKLATASEGRPLLIGVVAAAFLRQNSMPDVARMPELLRPIVDREVRQWKLGCSNDALFEQVVSIISIGTLLRGLPLLGPDDPIIAVNTAESAPQLLTIKDSSGVWQLPTLRDLDRLPEDVINQVEASQERVLSQIKHLIPGAWQRALQVSHDLCPMGWVLEPDMFGEMLLDQLWDLPLYFDSAALLPQMSDEHLQAWLTAALRINATRTIATFVDLRLTTSKPAAFMRALRLLVASVVNTVPTDTGSALADEVSFIVFNSSVRVGGGRSSGSTIQAAWEMLKQMKHAFPEDADVGYRHLKLLPRVAMETNTTDRPALLRQTIETAPQYLDQIREHPRDDMQLFWADTLVAAVEHALGQGDGALLEDVIKSAGLLQRSFTDQPELISELAKVYVRISSAMADSAGRRDTDSLILPLELIESLTRGIAACLDTPADVVEPAIRRRLLYSVLNVSWAQAQLGDRAAVDAVGCLIEDGLHRWADDAVIARGINLKLLNHRQMTLPADSPPENAARLAEEAWTILLQAPTDKEGEAQICLFMTLTALAKPSVDGIHIAQTLFRRLDLLPDTEGLRHAIEYLIPQLSSAAAFNCAKGLHKHVTTDDNFSVYTSLSGLQVLLNLLQDELQPEQAFASLELAIALARRHWGDKTVKVGLLECVWRCWAQFKEITPALAEVLEIRLVDNPEQEPYTELDGEVLEVRLRIRDDTAPESYFIKYGSEAGAA